MGSISKTPQRLILALLLAAAALAVAPCAVRAAAPPATPPPSSAAPKAAAPAPADAPPSADAKAAPAAPSGPQPPDGKWLKDKDGHEYFINKIAKEGLDFRPMDGHRVHTPWGFAIDVVKEDAKYYYYRVDRVAPMAPIASSKPSPDEVKKIEASYQVDTPDSHRLKFLPFSNGLPTQGQWRQGFDLADMNEDGHLDIVHSPARKTAGPPVIFLGDGKGNWRRWTEAKFPPLPYDYGDAAVGDFNGDGHMDIALGVHLRGLLAMLGDGKGHFKEDYKGLDFVLPGQGRQPGFSSRTIAVTDWNHDGRPDILAVGEGPRLNLSGRDQARVAQNTESYGVIIYLGQPDGTWLRKDQGTSTREIFAESIALGDFNGDHRMDFATGSSVMGRRTLVNYSREDGGWNTVDVDMVRPRSYVSSVDAVDLNGDGLDDLVVGYMSFENATWRSGIDVLYAHKDGTWTRRGLAAIERREQITALSHGDLDGDRKTDLVALTATGETWVFLNDGRGWFTREAATGIPPYAGGCGGFHVRLADLDGDGKDEIVADFAGENSPVNAPDACPTGGGILAWHSAPAGPP
ncbi:MAG TPA: VCBS repeat-containing protein [Thermoanaerobaculia bacterium]|jgi:hypothetical protein